MEGTIIKDPSGGGTRPISEEHVFTGNNCEVRPDKEAYFNELYKGETRPQITAMASSEKRRQIREAQGAKT